MFEKYNSLSSKILGPHAKCRYFTPTSEVRTLAMWE